MKVPPHWKSVTLNDIAKWGSGGTPKSTVKEYYDGDIPWLIIGDLNDSYINMAQKHITKLGLENSSAKIISPNNVLVAMYGSIGKLGINKIPLSCNQAIAYTKELLDNVSNLFLFYYLMSIREKLHSLGKGGTQKNISQTVLKKVDFPLPPIEEQNRIVNKIESLLSELDSSIENLQRAKEKLKLYRQSVLKSAFEGKLTEAWRQAHADELEDAESILSCIKQEREAAYEESLTEWEASVKAWEEGGKVGKKPAKPRKPKELPPLSKEELAALPKLPEGWKWIRAGELFKYVTSGSRGWAKYYAEEGAVFVRITNLNFNSLSLDLSKDKIQYVSPPSNAEGSRTKIQKNDFLFSITGYLGMFAIAPKMEEAYVNQHIALARPITGFNYTYFGYFVTSESGGLKFLSDLQKGAVKAGLRLDDILEFPIPLCSLEEQNRIVSEIDIHINKADFMEKAIDTSLKKAESLRQSILKSAFEGRLVKYENK